MSAKQKSDKDNSAEPSLDVNKDQELEKKVDAMLSIEESAESERDSKGPKKTVKPTPTAIPVTDESEKGGAPLLPTDKLSDLGKKKSEKETKESAVDEELPQESTAGPEEISIAEETTEDSSEDLEEAPVEKPAAEPDQLKDELGLEDEGTNQAVDEIAAEEADASLAADDKKAAEAAQAAESDSKTAKPKRKHNFFGKLVRSKGFRVFVILAVLAGIAAAAIFPTSRYFALNAVGVRVGASVKVLDDTTGLPLKNAEFSVAGQSGKTDDEGNISLNGLKLGKAQLKVAKPAFAEVNQSITLGWGSNPLGEYKLKAVGSQYRFMIIDFLSKKPIAKAEAISGDASALSNEKGEAVLTVSQADKAKIEVQVRFSGYRTETLSLPIDATKETKKVEMVPARKQTFVSRRSGTLDLYKIDVDGKNEEKVLPGNGSERAESTALAPHPTKDVVAFVSNRDISRRINGNVMSNLTIVNLKDNSNKQIASSERIQLIDWIGDHLVYVKIAEGTNKDSQDRHKVMSYDIESDSEKELASSNYFNDIISVNKSIYYSPAAYQVKGSVGLFKIDADGNNKKTIYDKEVWNLLRTSFDTVSVSVGEEWFDLNVNNDAMDRASGAPTVTKTKLYIAAPTPGKSLWVDERDGKGVLLAYDQHAKEDKILQTQSGLKYPVQWLSDKHVVYRINSAQETADYIFNIEGGESRKIRDVTDTAGIDRWYYY